jgi:hypothetical protein
VTVAVGALGALTGAAIFLVAVVWRTAVTLAASRVSA